ncbi:small GTP-binding protein [Histomonas meleagridis]|uniref:small GTP-binding protein n=1 Tax=Histomonas meleagridis TaxID=135588 RepID=UPI00355AB9F8|nr:small GTP-binding protein [Histomonas meleagridis]KAH0806839.1 small GTP-binding protein [Histomonas meleagridis]
MPPPDFQFKVCLLGAVAVGKTAIANKLQFGVFEEDYQPTIGAGYIPYRTKCNGKEVELQIWDTAGMERYKTLGSIYYRDAHAAILVYDQTSLQSSDALKTWLSSFKNTVKNPCVIFVAANKNDLPNKLVPNENIRAWCQENSFGFFITSAKTGDGVQDMFNTLADKLMEANPVMSTGNHLQQQEEQSGCC